MSKKNIFVSYFFVVAFALSNVTAYAASWTLAGKVVDAKTLSPIAGAKVAFIYDKGGEIETFSDDNGNYLLKPEVKKAGNLVVNAPNYLEGKTYYHGVDSPRAYNRYDFKIDADFFTIKGKITDSVSGDPVVGADVVFIYDYKEGQTDSVKTDEKGRYSITPKVGKGGNLKLSCDDYIESKVKFSPRYPYNVEWGYYEIRPVKESWTLSGKVIENKTLFSVNGAEVAFVYDEGSQTATSTTDAFGNFEVKPLINKSGKLVIKADTFLEIREGFSPRSSGRETYNGVWKLNHDYWTISGTLLDYKTGDAATGVSAYVVYDKTAEKTAECKVDERGYYNFKIAVNRAGSLVFEGKNWVTRTEHFSSRGSDVFEIWNYELNKSDESFTICGRVTEKASNDGIEGAKVAFVYEDGSEVATYTDSLGNYAINPLVKKLGRIVIAKDSFVQYKDQSPFSRDNGRIVEKWNYSLYHNYWTLTGKITDYKTGNGVKGATVSFFYEDGSEIETVTDEKGNYRLTPQNDKAGKIIISGEGLITKTYGPISRGCDVVELFNYEINKVKDEYTLVGRVTNDNGDSPIAEATVEYIYADKTTISATTDANGIYTLSPEINKKGKVTVKAEGFNESSSDMGAKNDSRVIEYADFKLSELKP